MNVRLTAVRSRRRSQAVPTHRTGRSCLVTLPASTASTRLCNHPIRPDRSADDGHAEGRDSTARFVVTDAQASE